jgi:predicted nuclease with TOPRIM domain
MSWKEILKEVSPRERMDAEDFAPKEMQQFRDEKHQDAQNSIKEKLREYLRELESPLPMDEAKFKETKKRMKDLTRPLEGFDHEWFMDRSREEIVDALSRWFSKVGKYADR